MRMISKLLLASALLSGTVSLNVYKADDKVVIEADVEEPEKIIDTTVKLIGTAGSVIRDITEQNAQPATRNGEYAGTNDKTVYRIRNEKNEASSQIGAYAHLEIAENMCPSGYCVFDSSGNLLFQRTARVSG